MLAAGRVHRPERHIRALDAGVARGADRIFDHRAAEVHLADDGVRAPVRPALDTSGAPAFKAARAEPSGSVLEHVQDAVRPESDRGHADLVGALVLGAVAA